jgi:hypothetical protein
VIWLVTIIPSRKATKEYQKENADEIESGRKRNRGALRAR